KPVADCIPGPRLRRLRVGLDVEGKPFWLAAERHHLVHCRHRRFLCCHCPSRRVLAKSQSVGEGLPQRGICDTPGSIAAMNVSDLLSFNLFLQFIDGFVSHQAFALGAAEANPVVAAAIVNWGTVWGLIYNKALACLLLLLIFALRRNRRLMT